MDSYDYYLFYECQQEFMRVVLGDAACNRELVQECWEVFGQIAFIQDLAQACEEAEQKDPNQRQLYYPDATGE